MTGWWQYKSHCGEKGNTKDKNTWRGVTLLSVGTKLLARIVAMRTQMWLQEVMDEEQNGFRKGRGADDVHQVTMRLVDTLKRTKGNKTFIIAFYDIEKAYPKICREALWELLKQEGADPRYIAVCKALHDHTQVHVRVEQGKSDAYSMERGLREGCPSSPPLFNAYHMAVMRDFRQRRRELAENMNLTAGAAWCCKVDGRLQRGERGKRRSEDASNRKKTQ